MSAAELHRVLGALADDTRWEILQRLGTEGSSASALSRELPVSRQAVAKHIAVLDEAGLVSSVKVGRELRFRIRAERLAAAGEELRSLAEGWQRRLEAIRALAEREE